MLKFAGIQDLLASPQTATVLALSVFALACEAVDAPKRQSSEDEGTGSATADPGEQCVEDTLGGAGLCLDTGMWALEAWQQCKDQGLFLADFAPFEECGTGLFERTRVTCCGANGQPGEPGDPDRPDEPGCVCDAGGCWGECGEPAECERLEVHEGGKCMPPELLRDRAVVTCHERGQEVSGVEIASECGDGTVDSMIVTCCGVGSDPEPWPDACATVKCGADRPICQVQPDGTAACVPGGNTGGVCSREKIGFDGTCLDPASLEKRAWLHCEEKGARLTTFAAIEFCPDGGSFGAEIECCEEGGPDQPPPPDACVTFPTGATGECQDPGYFKELAWKLCTEQGLQLSTYEPIAFCDNGGILDAHVTCCGSGQPTDPNWPPAEPTSCYVDKVGFDGQCVPVEYLEKHGWERCAMQGAEFQGLTAIAECDGGFAQGAEIQCCYGGGPVEPPPADNCMTMPTGPIGNCQDPSAFKDHAWKFCESQGLQLTNVEPLAYCDNGGILDGFVTCCGTSTPTDPNWPPTEPTACYHDKVGFEGACMPLDVLEMFGNERCASAGAQFAGFAFIDHCENGNAQGAEIKCCGAPVEPPPPPPADTCIPFPVGGNGECLDPAYLKDIAWKQCAAAGLTLQDIQLHEQCDNGGAAYAEAICCGQGNTDPSEPTWPPDASQCFDDAVGYGDECVDNSQLEQWVHEYCGQNGQVMTMFSAANDCGQGSSTIAKFQCCGAGSPTPVPPVPACVALATADQNVCLTPEALKQEAWQSCTDQGLQLTEIGYAQNCADGTSTYAKFTCCK